ncbi:hypothetical protein PMAYCL1PPCAC_10390, partial [Pristionchus mayeri]
TPSPMLQALLFLALLSTTVLASAISKPLSLLKVTCDESVAMGKCTWDNRCEALGYMCDSSNELCCPVVDYMDEKWNAGPALREMCEPYFAVVNIPGGEPGGECINTLSIPGVCPITDATPFVPCVTRPGYGTILNCPLGSSCVEAADRCCPNDYTAP